MSNSSSYEESDHSKESSESSDNEQLPSGQIDIDVAGQYTEEEFPDDIDISLSSPRPGFPIDQSSQQADFHQPKSYNAVPASSSHISRSKPTASSDRSIVVPDLTQDPYAEEPSYFTRPNRFFGSASTWRRWTLDERTAANALDRSQARDLSLHLYHAHLLRMDAKVRAGIESTPRSKSLSRYARTGDAKGKGKERAISPARNVGDETGSEKSVTVPKSWTAWPMPPDEVPRDHMLPDFDGILAERDLSRKDGTGVKQSANLEDILVATFTKLARARWNTRQWDDTSSPSVMDTAQQTQTTVKTEDSAGKSTGLNTEHSPITSEEEVAEESESDTGDDRGYSSFQSHPLSLSSSESSRTESDSQDEEQGFRPVPIADDDRARSLVLPTTRHILTKLDDLLLGSHHARQSYAVQYQRKSRRSADAEASQNDRNVQDKTDDTETSDTSMNSNTTTESRGRSSSCSRGRLKMTIAPSRKRKREASSASTRTEDSATSSVISNDRARKPKRLGLRDWSDVVGMAALTGWDPAVIRRTSERCAVLFGENMLFRTFVSGDAHTTKDGKSHYTEASAKYQVDLAEATQESNISSTTKHKVAHTRETVSVADVSISVRISKACENCQAQQVPCEPHSSICSDISGRGKSACKQCIERRQQCSGIVCKGARTGNKICPYRTCERHNIPFGSPYHLQRHVDAVHTTDGIHALSDGLFSSSATSPMSNTNSEADSSALGSDANLVCPVSSCLRHAQAFSRGARLYQHVRNMHPELDIAALKKAQAKRRSFSRGRSVPRSHSKT